MDIDDIIRKIEVEAKLSDLAKDKDTLNSLMWYQEKIETLIESTDLGKDELSIDIPKRGRKTTMLGSMYLFKYIPKTRDKLPYWDEVPLVIPIQPEISSPGQFLGLNLHYLPPKSRVIFFEKLQDFKNNDKYNEGTKILMTYNFLKTTSKLKEFRATIKRYDLNHVRSQFIFIHPKEWNTMIFLPTQKFVGATSEQIWKDSKEKY